MLGNETMTIPIADAHVHFWDLKHNSYPWLDPAEPEGPFGKTAAIRHSFAVEQYRCETSDQNVSHLIHVEAGWNPANHLGEMKWIQCLADSVGAPHAHIAHVDLAADDAESLIDAHLKFRLFRGVRDRLLDGDFTATSASATRIDDPAWLRGLRALEERGLCFDLQAPPRLAAKAADLAARHPQLRFILTHAGYPPSVANLAAFAEWKDGLKRVADQSNVVVKLSGLPLSAKAWNPTEGHRAAETLLEAFGVDRVLAASNAPVDRLFVSIGELFSAYRKWVEVMPMADQRKVLHDNAVRIYRLLDTP